MIDEFDPCARQPSPSEIRCLELSKGASRVILIWDLNFEASRSKGISFEENLVDAIGSRHGGGVRWIIRESTAAAVGVDNQAFKLWTSATLPFVAELTVSSLLARLPLLFLLHTQLFTPVHSPLHLLPS